MYINVEQPVREAGWLMGIEAVVETAGILEFRVSTCKNCITEGPCRLKCVREFIAICPIPHKYFLSLGEEQQRENKLMDAL